MSKFKHFRGGPILSFLGGPEPPKHGPASTSPVLPQQTTFEKKLLGKMLIDQIIEFN